MAHVGDALTDADRERWDQRHSRAAAAPEPPALVEELASELTVVGRALDVACGTSGLCLWLAERGWDAVAVDFSEVALGVLARAAEARRLALRTVRLDLERDPLPAGPYELISCLHFHDPALREQLVVRLAPGGLLVLEQHTIDNLRLHPRPSARFLAERQALLHWAVRVPLDVVYYREGLLDGRCVARVFARKPRSG